MTQRTGPGRPASLVSRSVLAWCLYDFANSSYSAVIAAVVFPVYYTKVIVGNEAGLGDLWWGRAISLSMLLVAATSPFLGGIADTRAWRKRFLVFYTVLSVTCVSLLSALEPGMILPGFVLVVLANIGMEGGLVFYNAYLPELAPPGSVGRISAWGFGLGYAGSMVALLLSLPLVNAKLFPCVWGMVGAFFLFFSLPMFIWVRGRSRKDEAREHRPGFARAAVQGFRNTRDEFRQVWSSPQVRRFLTAFILYQDGVGTVIVFSSVFAATTLGFEASELILVYIVVQCSALFGAFAMARPTDSWGPKKVVGLSLALWILVTILAFVIETKASFWWVASIAGLGLGTVQAASRALFVQLIPRGREAAYFGIFALVGKTSAVLGPLLFGLVSRVMGSQRPAILSVAAFFLVGGIVLAGVKEPNRQPG